MKKIYKNREACFICSSPYQIIGAIGIVKSANMEADLYVTGEFPGYEIIAENLRKYNIFSDIYIASNKAIKGRGKYVSMKMSIFAEQTISSYMPKDITYSYYFASSRSTLKAAQLAVLRKRNPSIKRVVYEDGLGSYSDNGRLFTISRLRRFVEKLLGWDLDNPQKMSIMVYFPELISLPENLNDIRIEKMPRLELNDENRSLLSDVFSVSAEHNISERIIIFDEKRRGGSLDYLTSKEKEILDACYETIRKNVKDDCILKPHPKSIEESACSIKSYQYPGIPMEALYIEMKDIEQRVLISHVSTAVFTPKILFDSEPIIICLHRLLKDNRLSVDFESIYSRFRDLYRDTSKVMAPETVAELEKIIRDIH